MTQPASHGLWKFAIDVGGTFTDVVATSPDGRTVIQKLLSSGRVRGVVSEASDPDAIVDPARIGEPADFWAGYRVRIVRPDGHVLAESTVREFDPRTGRLRVDRRFHAIFSRSNYELSSDEEAPIVAIRCVLGLRLTEPIRNVEVRLGTTRATNALLERKGARVAFVTTRGFADVLKIGYQDRPQLFDLNIRKREELAECAIEIDERLAADGRVLVRLDAERVRNQLTEILHAGVNSLAICLLHAHVNTTHEEIVADIAREVGFRHVSVSSRLSRRKGLVPRGDTTVVDAYLGPIISDYVNALRRSLGDGRLQLMTSHGGLAPADHVGGKDTILSGPAGGVMGCAEVSRGAGFARVIGFDMGGTSTDVSRIEDRFEYQHETVKAGVRVVTPMLAVETVAAGGGSLCGFDGHHLFVGPKSAGANPGPACYGSGGPLTITDLNLLLGRLPASHFPFALDVDAARRRLDDLCESVRSATGVMHDPIVLAEGLIAIANETMGSTIRRISTAKGYDLREYALLSFGGAGGQHACALARTLGVRTILHSPLAGVLSAVGISRSRLRRVAERSVNIPVSPQGRAPLGDVIASMTEEIREQLRGDGVSPSNHSVRSVSLDVCYQGQTTFLPIDEAPWETLRDRFEAAHRKTYGYVHAGRAVDIRAIRVAIEEATTVTPLPRPDDDVVRSSGGAFVIMRVDGEWREIPILRRSEVDRTVNGPAILIEDTSTLVIDAGWEATVSSHGTIQLTDCLSAHKEQRIAGNDPVQLALFRSRFSAVAERMGTTLRRTALSTNVKDRLDFSCAVFTARGDLIANAPHIPVHLGGMSFCVKSLLAEVSHFEPGDAYVTNDPFRGGSHLNDITVITPVFGADRILFFVASRAHHAEIGGMRPGSMAPDATCLAQEGVLIRSFLFIDKGIARIDEMRELLKAPPFPSRAPEENLADLAAQVAANQTGAQDLLLLVKNHGMEVVSGYVLQMRESASRQLSTALQRISSGTYSFEDRLDDGWIIRATVTIADGKATFDFAGTDRVHPGNFNANSAIVTSAVLYCLRCLIDEDIPLNAGVLDPVEIIIPPSFLNPPCGSNATDCPAVGAGNVETSQRVVDCIFGALVVVAASQGTMNNLLIGNERFGYYETICGGAGAGPSFAGASAVHTHMTNTRLTDVEIMESRYPLRLLEFSIRSGSGGQGRHRGGDGITRRIELLEPLQVSIISQRRKIPPYGLCGGTSGGLGRNSLVRAGANSAEELGSIAQVMANAGDQIIIESPGGGGFGSAE